MVDSLHRGLTAPSQLPCRAGVVVCLLLSLFPSLVAPQSKGFSMGDSVAPTGRRLALVIGNKDYDWKPLANPVNDATDIAAALERDGFKVSLDTNLRFRDSNSAREMKSVVRQFVESVHKNDFAFVYYSGHGIEVRGTNYLLPIDLPGDATAGTIKDEAVSAQDLVSDLQDQGASVSVLVLDACRSNPIHANGDRDFVSGGLGRMDPGHGTLVVFPTQAGQTASDNSSSRNGLFTQYLLPALAEKGVRLDDAIRDAASQMVHDTGGMQTPALYGLLDNPVFLITGPVTVNVSPAQPEPDAALEAWNALKDTHNPQDLDDFVAAFPNSQYATSARLAANRLRRESAAASQPSRPNPEVSHTAAGDGLFTLVVNCDLPCKWQIDGEVKGAIQLGDVARAQVPPGDHILSATTTDGRDQTSQKVTGTGNSSKVVSLALQPVGEQRTVMAQAAAIQGESYRKQKDYPHALAAFQEACTGGDSTGCFGIGYMYDTGTGVSLDYGKAGEFFSLACDRGNMTSCKFLGYLYGAGLGVAPDPATAVSLYKQACNGNEAQACQYLGSAYFDGIGVEKNDSLAFSLFKQACDGNNMDGCDYQGDMYKRGESVPVDLDKARQLYDQACKGGNDTGCKNLKALTDAADASKPVTSSPQPTASSNPADVKASAEQGRDYYDRKDYQHALPLLQEACAGGDAASCRLTAIIYFRPLGVTQDHLQSAAYFRKGCDLGDMWGCNNLGTMYRTADGVPRNYPLAISLFRQACAGNNTWGCDNLGAMYQFGRSVSVDIGKARQLYDQACKGGDDTGCKDLKDLDTN